MSTILTLCMLVAGHQGRPRPFLAICQVPQGEVTVIRGGQGHVPQLCERLMAGDKLACGSAGTVQCYNFSTRERLTFLPRSTTLIDSSTFRVKSGRAPLRKPLPNGIRLPKPGPGAGILVSRGVSDSSLAIVQPRFGQREAPHRIQWNWSGPSSGSVTFRVRVFQPLHVAGMWNVDGPIDDPLFDKSVADERGVELAARLDPNVPYRVEISATVGDHTESQSEKFWVLDPEDRAAVSDAEAVAKTQDTSDSRSVLGFLYWQMGLYGDALKAYKEVLAKSPNDATALKAVRQLTAKVGENS